MSTRSDHGDGERSGSDQRVAATAAGSRRQREGRTRGWDSDEIRSERVTVRFTPSGLADIEEVARRLRMRPSAWIGEMAERYARGQLAPVPEDMRDAVREIVAQRPYVSSLGSLVNQVAKVANATGSLPEDTREQVQVFQRQVADLTRRLDELEMLATRRAQGNRR